jgi:adenine-specific DNA methylase
MTPADVLEGRARWCVVQADNAEVLPTLPSRSVDHVITDPPYEAEAHTLQRRVKRGGGVAVVEPLGFPPITEETRARAAAMFATQALRWTIVFCQVEAAMAWANAARDGGASIRRIGVWVKPDGQPQLSGDRPGMGYESFVCVHAPGKSRWNAGGKVGVYSSPRAAIVEGREQLHMTEKPLPIMEALVRDFTDPGDLILDPFAGSGTTGVAAIRLGRRFIGWEKDPKYHAIAVKRLKAAREQLELGLSA